MSNGYFTPPQAVNEPVKSYAPNSKERKEIIEQYQKMYKALVSVPLYIGSQQIFTPEQKTIRPPHDHQHIIGSYSVAEPDHVNLAIQSALKTKKDWEVVSWPKKASIFLKAADLVAGTYRSKINAATMLGQSKNVHQAEIDSACEWIDFLRFNVQFAHEIYNHQPLSDQDAGNRLEYRPLEGFVYAITPFNFTAIAANLPASAALMGNTVIWKPSDSQMYSAKIIMDIFKEAGLPDGVINMISGDAKMISDIILQHPEFAGLHFTGSTEVFKNLWQQIGNNIHFYKSFPKIVGETGGKNFILAHRSASIGALVTAIIRGGFEFQGQKCSAASRIYLPKSIADEVLSKLKKEMATIQTGAPDDFKNFVNAVIHKGAYDRLVSVIEKVKKSSEAKIIIGGHYDDKIGYFIEPTVVLTTNPTFETMTNELFGPIVTIFVYQDENWENIFKVVDQSTEYALTGAVFASETQAIEEATLALTHSAGNFYINDKPTGAVVGKQPFGGARASGTNDKAGSLWNLMRWVSPRNIKETFIPPTDYRYPFLDTK